LQEHVFNVMRILQECIVAAYDDQFMLDVLVYVSHAYI
jgi:hypothetical protein